MVHHPPGLGMSLRWLPNAIPSSRQLQNGNAPFICWKINLAGAGQPRYNSTNPKESYKTRRLDLTNSSQKVFRTVPGIHYVRRPRFPEFFVNTRQPGGLDIHHQEPELAQRPTAASPIVKVAVVARFDKTLVESVRNFKEFVDEVEGEAEPLNKRRYGHPLWVLFDDVPTTLFEEPKFHEALEKVVAGFRDAYLLLRPMVVVGGTRIGDLGLAIQMAGEEKRSVRSIKHKIFDELGLDIGDTGEGGLWKIPKQYLTILQGSKDPERILQLAQTYVKSRKLAFEGFVEGLQVYTLRKNGVWHRKMEHIYLSPTADTKFKQFLKTKEEPALQENDSPRLYKKQKVVRVVRVVNDEMIARLNHANSLNSTTNGVATSAQTLSTTASPKPETPRPKIPRSPFSWSTTIRPEGIKIRKLKNEEETITESSRPKSIEKIAAEERLAKENREKAREASYQDEHVMTMDPRVQRALAAATRLENLAKANKA